MRKVKLILSAVLLFASFTTFSQRQQIGTSNTYWEFILIGNDTALKISGNGDMPDFTYNSMPWYNDNPNIKYIEMGDSITRIGNWAFSNCDSLTSVNLSNSLISIGNSAFNSCYALISVIIPNSVTNIGDSAFFRCYLTSITIGSSVATIGNYAFFSCRFTSIDLGNSVQNIGNYAFAWCHYLTSLIIPNSVIIIGNRAFENCYDLTSVTIGNSVRQIGSLAFRSCIALTSITISNSVSSIGEHAFEQCNNLISIIVDSSNLYYSSLNGVLYDKNKNRLIRYPSGKTGDFIIPNTVALIESSAFHGSRNLTSLMIPNSVTTIEDNAFGFCTSLTSLDIPNSVTTIGYGVFANCNTLRTVSLGSLIDTISFMAFGYCVALTEIVNLNPVPINILTSVFTGVNKSACILKIPTTSLSAYMGADVWRDFNVVGAGYIVDVIANNVIYGQAKGRGLYLNTATLEAIANNGYKFENWTSNGILISTDNPFSFSVAQDTNIIANFVPLSTDATLADLWVNEGTLSPGFHKDSLNYILNVENRVTSITLTAQPTHSNATIVGEGTYSLQTGNNIFNIIVTAEDSITQQTYTVMINRATSKDATLKNIIISSGTLNPNFHKDSMQYEVNLAYEVSDFTLTAIANDSNATINGEGTIQLAVGKNTMEILVTAEDDTTCRTYIILITRTPKVGIKDIYIDNNCCVYPNPVKDILHFQSSSVIEQISIYDISGRTIKEDLRVCPKTEIIIDISYLPTGIYFVKIKIKDKEIIKKIIKQ